MKTMKNMKQSRFILFVLSFLVMSVGNVYAQNVTVTGTVLDSTGEPVIGANVKVAGKSSIGTGMNHCTMCYLPLAILFCSKVGTSK